MRLILSSYLFFFFIPHLVKFSYKTYNTMDNSYGVEETFRGM